MQQKLAFAQRRFRIRQNEQRDRLEVMIFQSHDSINGVL